MAKLTGKKIEMTQVFQEADGTVVPVTILAMESVEGLEMGKKVKITGISKGKGFAGVVKRWSFSGGPKTHGQSDRHRAPGSIGGGTDPGRVWKGQKMAGRMGNEKVTLSKVPVVEVDEQKRLVKVKGAVPGSRGSRVTVEVLK